MHLAGRCTGSPTARTGTLRSDGSPSNAGCVKPEEEAHEGRAAMAAFFQLWFHRGSMRLSSKYQGLDLDDCEGGCGGCLQEKRANGASRRSLSGVAVLFGLGRQSIKLCSGNGGGVIYFFTWWLII